MERKNFKYETDDLLVCLIDNVVLMKFKTKGTLELDLLKKAFEIKKSLKHENKDVPVLIDICGLHGFSAKSRKYLRSITEEGVTVVAILVEKISAMVNFRAFIRKHEAIIWLKKSTVILSGISLN